jgi:hypothetical protein
MSRICVRTRIVASRISCHYVCPWRHGQQCFGAPNVSERRHRCAARHPPQAASINIAAGLHKSVQGRGCKRHGQLDAGPASLHSAAVDENDETVVEQKFNGSAGEFRMDRVRVVRAKVDPRQLNFERRKWTIYSVRDANGCNVSTSMEGGRLATVSAKTTTVSGSVSEGLSDSVINSPVK